MASAHKNMNYKIFKKVGFTTVELLVTVTIMAVLAILVIVAINPVDLLKQGRDSNRVAALNSINGALRFLTENEPGTFIGTSSVVYVSIPDTSSTCANLGLPTLPSGWTYNCVLTASSTRVDGTGWIPVDFQAISAGSPISQLPIDSKNSTSTRNYFTYVASGNSWAMAFSPEAEKNKLGGTNNLTIKDGGQKASLFELGKDLSLLPLDYGDSSLVGYWDFEEATGTVAYDRSGKGANETWSVGGTAYAVGKVGTYAGQFSGSTYTQSAAVFSDYGTANKPFSFSGWVKINSGVTTGNIIHAGTGWCLPPVNIFGGKLRATSWGGSQVDALGTTTLQADIWYHFVSTWDSSGGLKLFVNGVLEKTTAMPTFVAAGSARNIYIAYSPGTCSGNTGFLNGFVDDVRIHNKALSIAEIAALYGAAR